MTSYFLSKTLQSNTNSWNESMITKELVGFQSFEIPTYKRVVEIDFWTKLIMKTGTSLSLSFIHGNNNNNIYILWICFLYAKWKMVLGFSICGLFPTTFSSRVDHEVPCGKWYKICYHLSFLTSPLILTLKHVTFVY